MTTFERFEQDVPRLMTELAPARTPDYFDDMLRQTARTRQRPAWSAFERWLPMGVIARPIPRPPIPVRSILVLALVGLLLAAALVAYAGSRPRVPAPFGPAANGLVVIGTTDGDIATVDATTGETRVVVGGATNDHSPWTSHDGRRFLFAREVSSVSEALFVADMDGSNLRQLASPGTTLSWFEWSPDDTKLAGTSPSGGLDVLSVLDVASGHSRTFELPVSVREPWYRPNGHEIVFTGDGPGDSDGLYLINDDGTGLRPILPTTSGGADDWRRIGLSPDGRQVAYERWRETASVNGRIHIVDIDRGVDRVLALGGDDGTVAGQPVWSPDGSRLAFLWFGPGTNPGFKVATAPVTGGAPVTMGPAHMGDLGLAFSPDGRSLLVNFQEDGSTWLFDVATGNGRQVDWSVTGGWAWQRLAP